MATTDRRNKTSFIRDAGYLLGTFVLTTAIALVPTYLVLRLLSVEDYGRLKLLLLIVSLSFMSELGVGKALRRSYPIMLARGEEAKIVRSVGVGYVFIMLSGLALCGLMLAAYVLGGFDGLSLNLVIMMALCANILCEKSYRYLQIIMVSEARFGRVSGLRLAGSLLGLLVVPGVYLGGVEGYLLATALSEALMVTLGWRLVAGRLRPQWHWPVLRPLLVKGLGFLTTNLQGRLFNRLEPILIAFFLPIADMAIYSVAFQAVNEAGKLYNPLAELVLQRAARTKGISGEDSQVYRDAYLGPNAIILLFSCFAILPLVYYAATALIELALPKYKASLPLLVILSVAYAFHRGTSAFKLFLVVAGRMKLLNMMLFLCLALNLALDLGLMWSMGLQGLAWGAFGAYVFELSLTVLVVYRVAYGEWRSGILFGASLLLISVFCLALFWCLQGVGDWLPQPTSEGWLRVAWTLGVCLMQCAIYLGLLLLCFALVFRRYRFWPTLIEWVSALRGMLTPKQGTSLKLPRP